MSETTQKLRLDKWLWAARFFKTRALALDAIKGGKVHVNGQRVKPARTIDIDDRLEIRRGVETFEVIVRGISAQRRPASEAAQLYEETEASRQRRAQEAEQRRLERLSQPQPAKRPSKRDRRRIIRFKNEH